MKGSIKISWLLRHGMKEVGLKYNATGWISIKDVLNYFNISFAQLEEIVNKNNKKRFEMTETSIRACQGHSKSLGLNIAALEKSWKEYDGDYAWHGTTNENVQRILKDGLKSMKRTHVHMAPEEKSVVGKRHNTPVMLKINVKRARMLGIKVFCSSNGVVLAREIPASCIEREQL
jgi:putative RNA 2'-phosphotransferase